MRPVASIVVASGWVEFPFLFGGAFIEVTRRIARRFWRFRDFPFLFGGAFIKASRWAHPCLRGKHVNFPYSLCRDFP